MYQPSTGIRSACDRCHYRKVRCVVVEERHACVRCLEQDVPCLFSPPGRNGRPPRNPPTPDRRCSDNTRQLESDASDVPRPPTPSPTDLSTSLFDLGAIEFDDTSEFLADPVLPPTEPSSYTFETQALSPQNNSGIREPTSTPSDDIMYLLPRIQRELHELKATNLDACQARWPSTSTCLSSERFGAFAELVERLHQLLRIFLSSKLTSSPDGTTSPCDFSVGISFISAIALTLEIYEVLTRRHPQPESMPPSREYESFHPVIETTTMQIGCFTPSQDLARWISLNIVVYEISTSRKLLDEMRRNFLRLQSTVHLGYPDGHIVPATTSAIRLHRPASVSVLTAGSCCALMQLCDDLLVRFRELERVVVQGIRWRQPGFDDL